MAVENAAVAVGNTTLTQETVHQDCWRSWTQHIVEISAKIISIDFITTPSSYKKNCQNDLLNSMFSYFDEFF